MTALTTTTGADIAVAPRVLIIDDNQLDAHLLREAFAEAGFLPAVSWAPSGVIGLNFLAHFTSTEGPLLVVLDLNMPGMSGREILRTMRQDEVQRRVPVLIFSTSTLSADRQACEALGTVDFIRKPSTFPEYQGVVERIRNLLGSFSKPLPPSACPA